VVNITLGQWVGTARCRGVFWTRPSDWLVISLRPVADVANAGGVADSGNLRSQLSWAVTNPAASCLLFYPYGSFTPTGAPSYRADTGRGNAVTDNFFTVAKPGGWDIGADLGSAWNINYPLAATTAGIALSSVAG
jgi:hypothetical protein